MHDSHINLLSLTVCRSCFISNDDSLSLSSFCRAASVVHPDIRRSNIPDTLWGQYIFEIGEEFCRQPNHKKKKMVTCVGRQPGSKIWVFGPDVQVDHRGKQIEQVDVLPSKNQALGVS